MSKVVNRYVRILAVSREAGPADRMILTLLDNDSVAVTRDWYFANMLGKGRGSDYGYLAMFEDSTYGWTLDIPKVVPAGTPRPGKSIVIQHHVDTLTDLLKDAGSFPSNRELSLYRTKLEEAQMWLEKYLSASS